MTGVTVDARLSRKESEDRSLESFDFAMRGVPWSALGRAVGVVLIALGTGGAVVMFMLVSAYQATGLVIGCILCLAATIAMLAPTILRATRTIIAVDESGIRITQVMGARYIPFSEIRHCAMYPWRKLLANELMAFGAGGEVLFRMPLMGPAACKEAGRLYRLIQHRTRPVPERHVALQNSLTRRQQPTSLWLEQLTKRALGSAYRSSTESNRDALIEVLQDVAYPVDVRSAAAAILASSGDPTSQEAVSAELHDGSPPLMHLAADYGTKVRQG